MKQFFTLLIFATFTLAGCGKEVIRSKSEDTQSPVSTSNTGNGASENASSSINVPVQIIVPVNPKDSRIGFPYCDSRDSAMKFAIENLIRPRSKELIEQAQIFHKMGLRAQGGIRLRFLGEDCREISGANQVCGPSYVASLAYAAPKMAPSLTDRAIAGQVLVSTETGQVYWTKTVTQAELQSGAVATAPTLECPGSTVRYR